MEYQEKECSKCKKVKSIEDFNKDKHKKYGVANWCKECRTWIYRHPKGDKHICRYCGEEFIPKVTSKGIYCSRLCNDISRKKKSIEKQIIKQNFKYQYICTVCNKAFESRIKLKRICCSDSCLQKYEHDSYLESKKSGMYELYLKEKRENYRSSLGLVSIKKLCIVCGEEFETVKRRQKCCGVKCTHRYFGRINKSLRRARARGLEYETIDPIEILVRDKWHCKICGVSTPKILRGTIEDNAPELDHIIPLSKDGPHIKENVRCLCRKCNGNKSNKINLQLQFA